MTYHPLRPVRIQWTGQRGDLFMDIEKYARQVRSGSQGEALDDLARSEAGARLAAKVDGQKLTQAAKAGDMQTLGSMLRDILATPEGQDFASQVRKVVKADGQ